MPAVEGAGDRSDWTAADFGGDGAIASTLRAMPLLVDQLWRTEARRGETPLIQLRRVAHQHPRIVLSSLDRLSGQLVQYLATVGSASRADLLAEAPDGVPELLDARVERLVTLGVAGVEDGRVTLAPRVAQMVPLPLPSFRSRAIDATSEHLRSAAQLIGVDPGPTKPDRVEAIESVLLDRERFIDAVAAAHPAAERVFVAVLEASTSLAGAHRGESGGPGGVFDVVELQRALPAGSGRDVDRALGQVITELQRRCLIGGDRYSTRTWIWLESLIGLTGHMFRSWAERPFPEPRPIDEPVGVAAAVVVATGLVVELLGDERVEGKRSGDRRPPLKAAKRAAAQLGLVPSLAQLLLDVAIDIGLLAPIDVEPEPGRGRGRGYESRAVHWVVDEERLATWHRLPPADRWLTVVRTWLHGSLDTRSRRRDPAQQIVLLAALADLPEGTGIAASDLVGWLTDHHGTWVVPDEDLIRDLALLGITSSGPTVGLGRAGRAMLADSMASTDVPAELHEVFDGDPSIVVQPDHTIISSAAAPVEVLEMLTRIAERESDGPAVVWRLSTERLGRAARQVKADDVVAFLSEHSSVPVAGNVERMVRDAAVAPMPALVEAVATLLTCEDPAVLAAAVAVRAARLRALTDTIAVSALPRNKVREALHANGVPNEAVGLLGDGASDADELQRSWLADVPPITGPLRCPGPVPVGPGVVSSYAELVRRTARPDERGRS